MHTNRNAIVYGLSAGSGLPGHIRFSRSEYRYSMLWFSLVIGFLQKKYTENLEVMKFFILSLSLWYRALRYRLFFNFQRVKRAFFRWISYFFRSFSVFVICYHCHRLFLRRVRYTIPSGGMWPMDRPCPYAAGTVCIYTDHRKPKTIIPE
jgi:hypothetical protein